MGMPTLLEAVMDAPTLPHKLWTREDCAVLEKAGLIEAERYELIEGELMLKMGKKSPHMHAVMLLVEWLRIVYGSRLVAQEVSIDVRPEDNPTNEPEPDAIVLNRSFVRRSSARRSIGDSCTTGASPKQPRNQRASMARART